MLNDILISLIIASLITSYLVAYLAGYKAGSDMAFKKFKQTKRTHHH